MKSQLTQTAIAAAVGNRCIDALPREVRQRFAEALPTLL